MSKTTKVGVPDWLYWSECLSEVVFSGFYESHEPPPSGDVRGIAPAHCHGHRNGQQSGYMLHHCNVCCRPGGRRGNTERVVARWQCPVASNEALVMLHREMRFISHRRTAMAIKMASKVGTCCIIIVLIVVLAASGTIRSESLPDGGVQ